MNVNGKYIKDENGNIISPVTSADTVFDNNNQSISSVISSFVRAEDTGEVGEIICNSVVDSYSTKTTDAYSCNYINNLHTYSTTDEIRIGTWIDGKPIYRKVIIKYIDNNDVNTFNHNIDNVDIAWLSGNSFLDVNGTFIPLNYYRYSTDNNIYAHVSQFIIYIRNVPAGWKSHNAYFVIEYTKTTD